MSKTHRFVVTVSKTVIVNFDDSIIPDDEWQSHFYPIKTPQQLAEHLAYNYVANDIERLSQLDGFADKKDSLVDFTDELWEVESDVG